MERIDRESLAASAAERWRRQYGRAQADVRRKLESLGPHPRPDDVDAAIGNKSWTAVPKCDECGREDAPSVVRLGEEPDYESSTAHVCGGCLLKAFRLLEG